MAIGKAPFDHHMKDIRHAFHEMARPYNSTIQAKGVQFGYVTFEIGLHFQDKTVWREVGPFDMGEDFDHRAGQTKIGKAIGEATRDACNEMMDPHGELKTKSVREIYQEIGA